MQPQAIIATIMSMKEVSAISRILGNDILDQRPLGAQDNQTGVNFEKN
jgi:hypothetical protein